MDSKREPKTFHRFHFNKLATQKDPQFLRNLEAMISFFRRYRDNKKKRLKMFCGKKKLTKKKHTQ
jgi:hypothetical protein